MPRSSLCELAETIEFGRLSPKMSVWVLTYLQHYIDTGILDTLLATNAAYQCQSEKTARVFGYQLLANPKIKAVLHRFFDEAQEPAPVPMDPERKKLIVLVRKQLRAAEPGSVAAQRLTSQLQGLILGGQEEETAKSVAVSKAQVPADALETWSDPVTGVVIGYRDSKGEAVQL